MTKVRAVPFLRMFAESFPTCETAFEPDDIRDLLAEVDAAVAAERERCAKIAEDEGCGWKCDCGHDHAEDIAAKIREEKR